jgi:hypothetical protein
MLWGGGGAFHIFLTQCMEVNMVGVKGSEPRVWTFVEDYCFMGCHTGYCDISLLLFRVTVLSPSSGLQASFSLLAELCRRRKCRKHKPVHLLQFQLFKHIS